MLSGHIAANPSSQFRLEVLEQSAADIENVGCVRQGEYEALRMHPPPGVSAAAALLTYACMVEEGTDHEAMRIDAPPGLGPTHAGWPDQSSDIDMDAGDTT